ncbi:MAG: ABC transporter ATP-binding protein/permease [Lachnospiraceae bacterium]|jgi:ABC-type multidrug transport system fused ATPase/permease subunit|nr:ABC transporter ATP-binding protein/permease [Lachnospiraceae bacterium]
MLEKRKYGFIDMITLAWKAAPLYALNEAVVTLIGALIPTAQIFVTASFFEAATAVYYKEATLSAVVLPVVFLGLFRLWSSLTGVWSNWMGNRRRILLRRRCMPLILQKQANLEYQHIENSETADLINRVAPDFPNKIWELYGNVSQISNVILSMFGVFATLFTQVWWIALVLILLSVPLLLIANRAGKESYSADKEMSKIDRRVWYLSSVLMNRENVEERSVFGYTDALNEIYIERSEYARKFRLKVRAKNFIKSKSGGLVLSIYCVAAMAAMLVPVTRGEMAFGMFVALMGAVLGVASQLSWGVNWYVESIARGREYLKDLTAFMALSDCPGASDLPKQGITFESIAFVNVRFTYPGTDQVILDGVSFLIERGKHYSFVGVNGAGKTTITKLLTGLYDSYEGEILIDGRELRSFSQAERKGLSSVVYQDFAKYFISLYENVAIADLTDETDNTAREAQSKDNKRSRHPVGAIEGKQSRQNAISSDEKVSLQNTEKQGVEHADKHTRIEKVLELVGLTDAIGKLKDGVDTPLGKIIEDGADISGGEWQRVAMARSVLSNAPLKILDEPTAALDPVAESNVYHNFEQISKGTTTIFISHRLGSTKLADIIYVIAEGKVREQGSHAQLMQQEGIYAQMFQSQAQWYQREEMSVHG